jgi:hypothetical protein
MGGSCFNFTSATGNPKAAPPFKMKPSRLLIAVSTCVIVFLFTFAATPLNAAAKKTVEPPVDGRKLIQSVNAKESTIVIQYMRDKSTHTYAIDNFTTLTLNNVSGKITDIKAGMEVTDYVERDGSSLDTLTLKGYGADPAKKKQK